MADRSFLAWPFLDDGHRAQSRDFEQWVERVAPSIA